MKSPILLTCSVLLFTATLLHAQSATYPARMVIPFQLHNHLIFVEATLNGHKEQFILDSGSPVLVLNSAHVPAGAATGPGRKAAGVSGKIDDVGIATVNSFDWGGMQLHDMTTTTMNLDHLEKATHHQFAGLIGYDVFKNYEVTFNYKEKTITLRKTDEKGTLLTPADKSMQPLCTVPLEMKYHVPIVNVKIGSNEYKMGIDCGASDNLLYQKYYSAIEPLCSGAKRQKMEGANKGVTKLTSATISTATIGAATFTNANTAFSDESLDQLNLSYNLGIDGLIGYEFLKQHLIALNFRKKEMSIY